MGKSGKNRAVIKESESAFLRWVCDYARLRGWLIYHPLPGRGRDDNRYLTLFYGHAGFPDLVLCRPPRLVFAELKTQHGRLTDSQHRWKTLLEQIDGVEYYLWRPSEREQIIEILS